MRIYLINLARRPDRLATMQAQADRLGLTLTRIDAVDAKLQNPDPTGWFPHSGPLGVISTGDKAVTVSHRKCWEAFVASGDSHAAFLEDDARLTARAGMVLKDSAWIPPDVRCVKLEHYGPPNQRIILTKFRAVLGDFKLGKLASRHTGAAAYILSRQAAIDLLAQTRCALTIDHWLFNPNNSPVFAKLAPWQLIPAVARQEDFVGANSDIEVTRVASRRITAAYVKREVIRFAYDLKLVPRQVAQLLTGAKFLRIGTEDARD
jgi:glycosyl transferase family 25